MKQSEITKILDHYFRISEINFLAFELGIDYRQIKSELKFERLDEFMVMIDEQDRVDNLVALLRRERPFLFKDASPTEIITNEAITHDNYQMIAFFDRVQLANLLIHEFDYDQLRTLNQEFKTEVPPDYGNTLPAYVAEFILAVEDHNQIIPLKSRLIDHFSTKDPIKPTETPIKLPNEPFAQKIKQNLPSKQFEELLNFFAINPENMGMQNDGYTNLLFYCFKNGKLPILISSLFKMNNQIPWDKYGQEFEAKFKQPTTFQEQLDLYFDRSDLRAFAFDLGLDDENIFVSNPAQSIDNLLKVVHANQRMAVLIQLLKKERPKVNWNI